MSFNVKKQLEKVEHLLIHGSFQEALKIIEKSLKKKDINKDEELRFLVLKSEAEFYLGNLIESIQLGEMVLKESERLDNIILQIEALTWLGVSYLWSSRVKESILLFDKGLKLISTVTNIPRKLFTKLKAFLLVWKGALLNQIGDIEKSLELTKEAIPLAEESGYMNLISISYLFFGQYSLKNNDVKNGREFIEKGFELANELGNKILIAYSNTMLAYVKSSKNEFEESIDLLNEAFSLSEEIGSTLLLAYKNDLGIMYRNLFQLDKALECYQECLKYMELKYIPYMNIGEIFLLRYDLKQSQKFYLKSMELSKKMGDKRVLPSILYDLIRISIELKDISKAQEYLTQLEQLDKETGFKHINRFYSLASILILKASGEINDLAEATKQLKSFLAEDDLPPGWRLDLLYALLEIRIKELQLSTNEETLTEVKKQIIRLEVEAEEQQLKWLLADVYRLHSQYALIELNAKKALEFLEKAQTIADEIDVELLKKKIMVDREKIEKQLSMLRLLEEQKAPLSETVKLASLESTVKYIKQETVLEERDKETGKIIEYRRLFGMKI